jgi:hypothetical protein
MDARSLQWLGPKEHVEEYCSGRGVHSDTRLPVRQQKRGRDKGSAPVRGDRGASEVVPPLGAYARDGSKGSRWGDCILPDAGVCGEQPMRHNGDRADDTECSGEGLHEGKEVVLPFQSDVSDGHWNETEEAIAAATGEGLRQRLDVRLEGMSHKALDRIDEILDLPIDPRERTLLGEIRKAAEVTLNLQLKVDETKLRQKNVSVLEELLTLIEAA